jgi:energy-coupling factor transporter transmembrane protein EcfT
MSTNVVTSTTVSGSTFILNVSALELTSDINIRDFKVTHNGIDATSSYAKTSVSQLTYTGASVVLGTLVLATRVTPLTTSETTFITTTTASELTNALNKLHRRVDELQAYQNYMTQLL